MKQVMILSTHSFVDVITNSSTELFVCDTDKSVEFIKEILQELMNTLVKANSHYAKYDYTVDGICNIYALTEESLESYKKEYTGWYGDDEDYPYYRNMTDVKVGNIIIEGTDDNSIPYPLFELIDSMFGARHYHLG